MATLSPTEQEYARLDALLEAVPLAVAVFDGALQLAATNARYRDLTGLDVTQAVGRSVYDAFPNALADVTEQVDIATGGVPVVSVRVPFQYRGGRRLVEATFSPLLDARGGRGLLFAGSDITEREGLREDLARSVAQLESIFDVLPDSVRVVDAEGGTVRTNAQAQQEHVPGNPQTLRELWQLDRPRTLGGTTLFVHEHPTARALRGERVRGETLEVRRGGEPAVIEVNSNPLYDPHKRVRGAVTVERDVTERTRLQQRVQTEAERLERMVQERTRELLALQEAAARDRRLAAVGQLAAGVMHDVNNALNPIMAAAYLLEMNAENPAAVRDYAVRIARAAETGAATAARVGRFIRQEPLLGAREDVVDLSVMVEEVVAMTRPLWQERAKGGVVKLEQTLADGALVRGIAGELREALLNLVQNALDAMAGGGTLRIVTRLTSTEASVAVSDTGTGMSAEVRERAFEPFFTTKGVNGTGLGLAEVYGIARRHRGRAEIESAPDEGTTVRLVFPPTSPGAKANVDAPPRRTPRRVLLVEDHIDSREFMQSLLESDGHTVEAVRSVEEAKARLSNVHEPLDVLVTDIGLPDGSGWDLVAFGREIRPTLRIGVVTGWEPRNEQDPACDFTLRKPVGATDLLTQIAGEG
ncbi:MAG TPA: PAS domain-containing protein [Gemmatimonadaceae bacterium]|nr:PAS domain-containing protein [Gemmatimonadaceae bacterium]